MHAKKKGLIQETQQKITALEEEDRLAAESLSSAKKERAAELQTNAATISDAKEGEEAVDQALQTLSDFYGRAASHGTPEKKDSSSVLQGEAGSNVINLLEVIQADFLKLRSETEAAESAAQKAYEEFVAEQQMASSIRSATLVHTKQANAVARSVFSTSENDLAAEEKVHAGLVEQKRIIEQEKGCSALSDKTPDELFQKRSEARNAEIESLRNALTMLSNE